jgi:hypothetical protein
MYARVMLWQVESSVNQDSGGQKTCLSASVTEVDASPQKRMQLNKRDLRLS